VIAFVRGIPRTATAEGIVIDIGGVGLRLLPTAAALRVTRVDEQVTLPTALLVREDGWTLVGFADEEERTLFEALLAVSGIGPRTALAALSVLGAHGLRSAIAAADPDPLTRVPGIGRKGASRIVLELSDRLPAMTGEQAPPAEVSSWQVAVVAGLISLGWSAGQAEQAVAEVSADGSETVTDAASGLRACLRLLGGRS